MGMEEAQSSRIAREEAKDIHRCVTALTLTGLHNDAAMSATVDG